MSSVSCQGHQWDWGDPGAWFSWADLIKDLLIKLMKSLVACVPCACFNNSLCIEPHSLFSFGHCLICCYPRSRGYSIVTLFSWNLNPHPPPRNHNNVEAYTFITIFSGKLDTPHPPYVLCNTWMPHEQIVNRLTVGRSYGSWGRYIVAGRRPRRLRDLLLSCLSLIVWWFIQNTAQWKPGVVVWSETWLSNWWLLRVDFHLLSAFEVFLRPGQTHSMVMAQMEHETLNCVVIESRHPDSL